MRDSVFLGGRTGAGLRPPNNAHYVDAIDFLYFAVAYGSVDPAGLRIGDIDGDGDVDIITALWFVNDPVGTIDVRFNDGDGRFSTKRAYGKLRSPETGAALVPTGIEASDLDGDGDLDLALSGSLLTVAGQPGYFSTIRNAGNNGAGRPRLSAARVIDAKADRLSSITARSRSWTGGWLLWASLPICPQPRANVSFATWATTG